MFNTCDDHGNNCQHCVELKAQLAKANGEVMRLTIKAQREENLLVRLNETLHQIQWYSPDGEPKI